jgi:hypothetical protein
MTKHPVYDSKACRRGMVLVRRREAVLPTGEPLATAPAPAEPVLADKGRPVHIVHGRYTIKDSCRPDRDTPPPQSLTDVTNTIPWESCCGTVFAPGTVELVAWGGVFDPHGQCIRKTGESFSFVERLFREARDTELHLAASLEDMESAIVALNEVMVKRDRDWVCVSEGDFWTYEGSFGAFPGHRINPRGVDLGLERLAVQIPFPGTVYVHTCGVRDGCPKHRTRTITFTQNDLKKLKESLAVYEEASTSFDLSELAWCLIQGDCAKTPVYWD